MTLAQMLGNTNGFMIAIIVVIVFVIIRAIALMKKENEGESS
jgi:hypothetical protein